MNSKFSGKSFFIVFIVLLSIFPILIKSQDTIETNYFLKEKLNHPYGTIMRLKIEIFDGDSLYRKFDQGSYLFKIIKIDDEILAEPVIIQFKDETGKFSTNEFELYKNLYGKEVNSLSFDKIQEMKAKYIGKVFNIAAYESGEFTGIPDGYFDYQPVRQDRGFFFNHYVIVIADLTKKN